MTGEFHACWGAALSSLIRGLEHTTMESTYFFASKKLHTSAASRTPNNDLHIEKQKKLNKPNAAAADHATEMSGSDVKWTSAFRKRVS